MKLRTRITTDKTTGVVTLTYTDWLGERRERRFTTTHREGTGAVIELLGDDTTGRTEAVCERLASNGWILISTRNGLADVIRREYRAMRRAERVTA